jgi:hypothetical protein
MAALPQNGATLRYEERLPDLAAMPVTRRTLSTAGLRQRVPLFGGGETALRAEANLPADMRGLLQTRFHPLRVSSSPFLVVINPSTTC